MKRNRCPDQTTWCCDVIGATQAVDVGPVSSIRGTKPLQAARILLLRQKRQKARLMTRVMLRTPTGGATGRGMPCRATAVSRSISWYPAARSNKLCRPPDPPAASSARALVPSRGRRACDRGRRDSPGADPWHLCRYPIDLRQVVARPSRRGPAPVRFLWTAEHLCPRSCDGWKQPDRQRPDPVAGLLAVPRVASRGRSAASSSRATSMSVPMKSGRCARCPSLSSSIAAISASSVPTNLLAAQPESRSPWRNDRSSLPALPTN